MARTLVLASLAAAWASCTPSASPPSVIVPAPELVEAESIFFPTQDTSRAILARLSESNRAIVVRRLPRTMEILPCRGEFEDEYGTAAIADPITIVTGDLSESDSALNFEALPPPPTVRVTHIRRARGQGARPGGHSKIDQPCPGATHVIVQIATERMGTTETVRQIELAPLKGSFQCRHGRYERWACRSGPFLCDWKTLAGCDQDCHAGSARSCAVLSEKGPDGSRLAMARKACALDTTECVHLAMLQVSHHVSASSVQKDAEGCCLQAVEGCCTAIAVVSGHDKARALEFGRLACEAGGLTGGLMGCLVASRAAEELKDSARAIRYAAILCATGWRDQCQRAKKLRAEAPP